MGDFYCIFCSGEYNQIMDKKITIDQALEMTKMSRSTFYKYIKKTK